MLAELYEKFIKRKAKGSIKIKEKKAIIKMTATDAMGIENTSTKVLPISIDSNKKTGDKENAKAHNLK